jgi:nucleotide-binding universal stress UspA family protein
MYKRILVATDGSALSKKAVASAISMAALCGAELVVMKVVPRYPVSYFEGGATISPSDVAKTEKSWQEAAEAVVNAVKDLAKKKGVLAKTFLPHSDLVAESIISGAKKHKCDLVVMASHGRKGIKRLLLGSETQHVLTHSSVPVLVLR